MFEYSVDTPLTLGLKKKPLSRAQYKSVVGKVAVYGNQIKRPSLSVVIVAYNEGLDAIEALERIFNQKTNRLYEVVFVDNGLDTATKERLKSFNIMCINMRKNIGCSAGRNVGSLFAKAPILGFVDADGLVDENFVNEALKSVKKYPVGVRGKVLPKTSGSETPPSYDLGDESFPYYINAEGISVWNKKNYIDAGGFEDVLYGGEGIVLQNRLIEIYGAHLNDFGYSPDLVLYHDYHSDKTHFKEKQTRYEIITRKINTRYPFLKTMIASYNDRAASFIPRPNSRQRKVSSQIEKVRMSVGHQFGKHYREQYMLRLQSPELVNGSAKDPKFSVVIPCYNVGRKLLDAVDSALGQSIESLEVIVVDDVSTDEKTQKVLSELDGKVKVVRRDINGGVAAARNTGIKVSKSDYVVCLDGDDTIEPEYLEEAYNVFEADDKTGLVSTWVKLVGARSGDWRPRDNMPIESALLASPVPTATCFRKSAWTQAGGYDERLRGYEDWNYWISIMKHGWKTRVLPRHHFNYTISSNSKVNTSNQNAQELVSRIFDNHKELYQKHIKFVVTNKYRDYAIMRSEYIELKAKHGERNTPLNLFRVNRYPNYLGRVYKKSKSFFRIAWDSKDPIYISRLFASKSKNYYRNFKRKVGFRY